MPKKNSAAKKFHSVAFDERGDASDGAGGTTTVWTEQFNCRASYVHLRGVSAYRQRVLRAITRRSLQYVRLRLRRQ